MLYTALHSWCNKWLHKQGTRLARNETRSKKRKQLDREDVSLLPYRWRAVRGLIAG